MRTFFLALILTVQPITQVWSQTCDSHFSDIVGRWQFTEFIYEGQRRPRPNQKLKLYFEYFSTGLSHLWWTRENESGFCERTGFYSYDNCEIKDEVVWVNPKNAIECGKDPDMHLGNKTLTRLERMGQELHLHVGLGGSPLIYILSPPEENPFN